MEAKFNPYRENPNRTKCEEFIYDQGYEAGIREVVGNLEMWHRTGEHLISDETIKALKKWGDK